MSPEEVDNGVVRIYCAGASSEDLEKIRAFCQAQGFHCQPTSGFGRPRGNYPAQKVLRLLRGGYSVAAAAREVGINRRHVYRILENKGEL